MGGFLLNVSPLLLDIPDFIESERLLIRALRFGDGKQLNEAYLESIQELKPWMIFAQQKQSIAETEEYVRRASISYLERSDMPMLIFLKGTNELVGATGLHRIKWEIPRFEIGYWVRTSMQGKGYVTEAVRSLTDFAFSTLGAKRVEIRCDARNDRSKRVAERVGFTLEAHLRQFTRNVKGELADELVFAMLDTEWRSVVESL